MSFLAHEVVSLYRNKKLLTLYTLIAILQVGVGMIAIDYNRAKQEEARANAVPASVVNKAHTMQTDIREIVTQPNSRM